MNFDEPIKLHIPKTKEDREENLRRIAEGEEDRKKWKQFLGKHFITCESCNYYRDEPHPYFSESGDGQCVSDGWDESSPTSRDNAACEFFSDDFFTRMYDRENGYT